ncbi:MAG: hypothetical protein SFT90_01565 [Rickettsiales bacterium]|nr:hypothetical protein [Rickettsiales bacterium]
MKKETDKITDDEVFYRSIRPEWIIKDGEKFKLLSRAFSDPFEEPSVDREALIEVNKRFGSNRPKSILYNKKHIALAQITAEQIRRKLDGLTESLEVIPRPSKNKKEHCQIEAKPKPSKNRFNEKIRAILSMRANENEIFVLKEFENSVRKE